MSHFELLSSSTAIQNGVILSYIPRCCIFTIISILCVCLNRFNDTVFFSSLKCVLKCNVSKVCKCCLLMADNIQKYLNVLHTCDHTHADLMFGVLRLLL